MNKIVLSPFDCFILLKHNWNTPKVIAVAINNWYHQLNNEQRSELYDYLQCSGLNTNSHEHQLLMARFSPLRQRIALDSAGLVIDCFEYGGDFYLSIDMVLNPNKMTTILTTNQ